MPLLSASLSVSAIPLQYSCKSVVDIKSVLLGCKALIRKRPGV